MKFKLCLLALVVMIKSGSANNASLSPPVSFRYLQTDLEWESCSKMRGLITCVRARKAIDGIQFDFKVNNHKLKYEENLVDISEYPTSVCGIVPKFNSLPVCFRFDDIKTNKSGFSGCMNTVINSAMANFVNLKQGCFDFIMDKKNAVYFNFEQNVSLKMNVNDFNKNWITEPLELIPTPIHEKDWYKPYDGVPNKAKSPRCKEGNNVTVCLAATKNEDTLGLIFTVDDISIKHQAKTSYKLTHGNPICDHIPELDMNVCLIVYKLKLNETIFYVCSETTVQNTFSKPIKLNLGCSTIKVNGQDIEYLTFYYKNENNEIIPPKFFSKFVTPKRKHLNRESASSTPNYHFIQTDSKWKSCSNDYGYETCIDAERGNENIHFNFNVNNHGIIFTKSLSDSISYKTPICGVIPEMNSLPICFRFHEVKTFKSRFTGCMVATLTETTAHPYVLNQGCFNFTIEENTKTISFNFKNYVSINMPASVFYYKWAREKQITHEKSGGVRVARYYTPISSNIIGNINKHESNSTIKSNDTQTNLSYFVSGYGIIVNGVLELEFQVNNLDLKNEGNTIDNISFATPICGTISEIDVSLVCFRLYQIKTTETNFIGSITATIHEKSKKPIEIDLKEFNFPIEGKTIQTVSFKFEDVTIKLPVEKFYENFYKKLSLTSPKHLLLMSNGEVLTISKLQ